MDEEDELALKLINAKPPAGQDALSEDQFEEVMNFFEEAAQAKQPFASVDSPPVLSLEELQEQFDDTHSNSLRSHTKLVYEHWASRRTSNNNRGLSSQLKFETGQESDDSDPYVTFRRRELRQIRKTRNRDAQSADKLRKLRLELESARNLLLTVRRREHLRREALENEQMIYKYRHELRVQKRLLNKPLDEDLLVNVKKPKIAQDTRNPAALAQQLRMPGLAPGAAAADLRTLEDVQAERNRNINLEINTNIEKHNRWNEGYVDKTKAPLTLNLKAVQQVSGSFREAKPVMQLPSPPDSGEDAEQGAALQTLARNIAAKLAHGSTESASSDDERAPREPLRSYRRRTGRGGRLIFDRKFPRPAPGSESDSSDDKFKYDRSDDEVVPPIKEDETSRIFKMLLARSNLVPPRPEPPRAPDPQLTAAVRKMNDDAMAAALVGKPPGMLAIDNASNVAAAMKATS
jgi:enhancer of polycomb-like protein